MMIGRVLKNRYKIYDKVGSGGMATVYIARDLLTNEVVAVKILKEELTNSPNYIKRFLREAEIVYNMNHENITKVKDFGVDENIYFIVMEYIEGKTLSQILDERGKLEIEEAVDITIQVLNALQYAYEHGIEAHRDIKPQNIMIDKNRKVKVMDFGIARVSFAHTMTQEGAFLGTPYYISPEQAQGKIVDIRSDIYSVGVTLYQLISGKPPFDSDTPWAIINMHITADPPDLNLPPKFKDLEYIIKRSLSKDKEKRYQTPKEFIKDLTIFRKGEGIYKKEEEFGEIFVNSNPNQAKVFLNGEEKGTTPLLIGNLKKGKYFIEVIKEDFDKKSFEVNVLPNKRAILNVDLYKKEIPLKFKEFPKLKFKAIGILLLVLILSISSIFIYLNSQKNKNINSTPPLLNFGTIVVKSEPSGLDIYLDGKLTGYKTPYTITSLEPRNYEIEVKYKNESKKERVLINAGETKEIFFKFTEVMYGTLIIDSEPRGAKIILDGKDTGLFTPNTINNVALGSHEIKLILEGYEDYVININLTDKKEIKAKLTKIETNLGTLIIETDPSGAAIFIDDDFKGYSPIKISLEKGKYKLEAILEGYEEYLVEINIEENKETKISIKLNKIENYGTLIIESTPKAKVYLNGEYKGETPITLELKEGEYKVKLTSEGYESYEKVVKITQNKEEKISVSLKKIVLKTYIIVNSTPKGAEVYIDRVFVGITNGKFEIKPGKHEILLKLEGYIDYMVEVNIKEGETKEINAILAKSP